MSHFTSEEMVPGYIAVQPSSDRTLLKSDHGRASDGSQAGAVLKLKVEGVSFPHVPVLEKECWKPVLRVGFEPEERVHIQAAEVGRVLSV